MPITVITPHGNLVVEQGWNHPAWWIRSEMPGLVFDGARTLLEAEVSVDGTVEKFTFRDYEYAQRGRSASGVAGRDVADEGLRRAAEELVVQVTDRIRATVAGSVVQVTEIVVDSEYTPHALLDLLGGSSADTTGDGFGDEAGSAASVEEVDVVDSTGASLVLAEGALTAATVAERLAAYGVAARVHTRTAWHVRPVELPHELELEPPTPA